MRLQPVEPAGGNRADVEPVDVGGVGEVANQLGVVGDAGADQRRPNFGEHLVFGAFDDGREGEHVFLLRDLVFRRLAMHNYRSELSAVYFQRDFIV